MIMTFFFRYVIMLLNDVELRKRIGMIALTRAMKFDHKHAAEKLEWVLKEGKKYVDFLADNAK